MINLPDTSTPEGQQAASVLLMKLIGYRLHRSDRMAYITNDPDTFAPSAFIPGETYRGNVPDTQKDAVFSFMCPNLYDKQHMWIAWDVLNWAANNRTKLPDAMVTQIRHRYSVIADAFNLFILSTIHFDDLACMDSGGASRYILDRILGAVTEAELWPSSV